jgi:RNA polymerase sigma factor (sigma-70 family)|tara:strand:+ start:391 stop:1023 length:633 start_codon:yes stop_codon:yes gene_type:complete
MMQSTPMKPEAPLLETRSSLIQRLKATINGESWEEFFHTYWELIYNVARRAGLSEADAQDIVQETILKVHNSLDRFEYNRKRGTFKGWLRTVTRSRLNDFFKKQQRRPALNQPLEEAADELQNLEDPEGPEIEKIWDEEWNRNLIQAALSRTKKLSSPKQFQIFKCHYIDEWTVRETCRTLGVNAAQVYMAKQRVGKIFREAVETLQEQV